MTDDKKPHLYPWQEIFLRKPQDAIYTGGYPPNPAVDTRLLQVLSKAVHMQNQEKHYILAGSYIDFKNYCQDKQYNQRHCVYVSYPIKIAGMNHDSQFELARDWENLLVDDLSIMLRFDQVHEWLSIPENRVRIVNLIDDRIILNEVMLTAQQQAVTQLEDVLKMLTSNTAINDVTNSLNTAKGQVVYWHGHVTRLKNDRFVLATYKELK